MADQPSRGERLQIILTPEELTLLDDFRFTHRIPSRAAAVRELLSRGLASLDSGPTGLRQKSRDFRVKKNDPKPDG